MKAVIFGLLGVLTLSSVASADEYGVAGIMAALISRHDIEAIGEEVDDFAFAFVAPLGAQDDYVSHWNQT